MKGRGGKRRGRKKKKNKVFNEKELLSIQMTTPYSQTYYNENHHVLEDFQILLL